MTIPIASTVSIAALPLELSTMPNAEKRSSGWKPISSAPWGRVVEVRNEMMDEPCLATRGYVYNGAVHENRKFFTTVYTPHDYFPTPAGRLVCPTEWRFPDDGDQA